MLVLLSSFLLIGVVHADNGMDFPSLPDSFSAEIEANILEKNYSLIVREYYDYDNNRYRIENHNSQYSHIELCDFNSQHHYEVNVTASNEFNCKVSPSTTCRMGPRSKHIKKASDFLKGSNDTDYYYTGEAVERGIRCDTWEATVMFNMSTFPSRGPGPRPDYLEYTLLWYFAKPSWSIMKESNHSVPISLHMEGGEYLNTGTLMKPFNHYYNFIDYLPTLADATHLGGHIFKVDPLWQCGSMAPTTAASVSSAPTSFSDTSAPTSPTSPTAPTGAPTGAPTSSPTVADVAVSCGAGTENKGGVCECVKPEPASDFKTLESSKGLVAILPALGLVLAVKLFM